MTSISRPLAVNVPHSLAANSGNAVIVKPALEILSLARRSWAFALAMKRNEVSAKPVSMTPSVGKRFIA